QARGSHFLRGSIGKFGRIDRASCLKDGAATAATQRGGLDGSVADGAGLLLLPPIGDRDFQPGASLGRRHLIAAIDGAAAVFRPTFGVVGSLAARTSGEGLTAGYRGLTDSTQPALRLY